MKRMHDTTDLPALGIKAGLIAATILLASANSAGGAESSSQVRPSIVMTGQRAEAIPLPPIPNLNAVPWLTLERAPKGPQIDTLLSPVPDNLQSAFSTRSRLPMGPDSLLAARNTPRNG
jgi:hypothetical protein